MQRIPLPKKGKAKPKYRWRNYDILLVLMAIGLSVIGVLTISSADPSLRNRQIIGIGIGVFMMLVISLIDYNLLLKFQWVYYAVTLLILGLVLTTGHASHGARRWINIGGQITVQPSEVAKIVLILFYAQFIMRYKDRVKTLRFVFLCVLLAAPILILVMLEPDLSTTIMLTVIFACVMFIGGMDWRIVAGVLVLLVPAAILVIYSAFWEESPFLTDYQQVRILSWLHPEDYPDDAYQTLNSMMAIGSGQMRGKGINNNEITSVLNTGFISESQTDFIFTVIGEEMGFIGAVTVVILIMAITVKCLVKAGKAKDLSGTIICAGVAGWIGFQGFLNIGVATGVMPNTGIPLPFVSSGLTSLVSVFMGIGLVLNVGLQGRQWFY